MCNTSMVSHIVSVWIVVNYDYYSLVTIYISAPLCRWRVATLSLYHIHSVQDLLFLQSIYKLPKCWMITHTNTLKFSVSTLYMVICAGQLLKCSMEDIPHLNWEIWGSSSCVFSEPTNVSIFKVIKNSISCIPILISD